MHESPVATTKQTNQTPAASIIMNYSSYHPSKHESGDRTRRIAYSSSAPPSVGELVAKISSLKMLRARMTSEDSSSSTELYKATADVNVNSIKRSVKHMQLSHIRMKSASCAPGPIDGGEERSCSTALTESTSRSSLVDSKRGFDMGVEIFHVPTKTDNCKPGPKLNPRSCASGLDLLALIDRVNDVQGNTRMSYSSLQNEDWDWDNLHLPQAQANPFLEWR